MVCFFHIFHTIFTLWKISPAGFRLSFGIVQNAKKRMLNPVILTVTKLHKQERKKTLQAPERASRGLSQKIVNRLSNTVVITAQLGALPQQILERHAVKVLVDDLVQSCPDGERHTFPRTRTVILLVLQT